MIGSLSRFLEDVAIGELLPSREFAVTLTTLVMYAGATWDFHRYHYDPDYVKAFGLPTAFMDGQMLGGLLGGLLMNWGGRDAFVRRLSYRQRETVFVGERIVLSGVVVEKSHESKRALAHVDLNVTKTDGTVVCHEASAIVELATRNLAPINARPAEQE